MPFEELLKPGMPVDKVAHTLRRVGREQSFLRETLAVDISRTAWLVLAVAVKRLEHQAWNAGVERAAVVVERYGAEPRRIRALKR